MKRELFCFFTVFVSMNLFCQSFDFGLEVQQNTNLVKKWGFDDTPSTQNHAFSVLDNNSDTLHVFFTRFSMTNNFEVPVYFRYNFKRRFFVDLKLSNTSHTLKMEGVSNYNASFFTSNFGTYNDFLLQAQADGFDTVSESDYANYIDAAKSQYEQKVSSIEEFKVLSFTANFGMRLLPHRSINPYVAFGFTSKTKYRKFSYQALQFSNSNVYDYSKVNDGVNRFAENTFYLNLAAGVEFYRFRAGIYYQAGFAFQATTGSTSDVVIYVNPYTPFERIHSYGFNICANLFSTPIGKRVVQENLTTDEIILSNIKRESYKWYFGLRFNRRGYNDVNTFYTAPDSRLSIMSRDSILYNNGTNVQSAEKVEMLTFGDVKKILWSGQLDLYATRNFGKRFYVEASLGSSSLTTDIETWQFQGTVLHDSINGNSWLKSNAEPRISSGVYRNVFNLSNFTITTGYRIIDRDLFRFSVLVGAGFTTMVHRSLLYVDLPDGVNELEIYNTIDKNYYTIGDNSIYAYQGSMNVDVNGSPDLLFNKFGGVKLDRNWPTPKPQRAVFPMVKIGFEAEIERYTLGLCIDRSRNYMDGFLLDKYSSIYFSVGYRFIRR